MSKIKTIPANRIISKKDFVKLLAFLKDYDKREEDLRVAAEALCPGEYINFFPACEHLSWILSVLDLMFGVEPQFSPLDYYVYELNYGTSFELGCWTDDGVDIDFSTPEKLYDYMLTLSQKESKGK